jgi:hypothetical protein
MAKVLSTKISFTTRSVKKRTSIGRAKASRPKNKDARRQHKDYRGQGYPL